MAQTVLNLLNKFVTASKLFYGVIPVESRLKQMRKSDGVCKLCNEGIENIEELFVRCPKWENFGTM